MKSTLFLTVGDAVAAIFLIPVLGYAFFMIVYAMHAEPSSEQSVSTSRVYSSAYDYEKFKISQGDTK